MISKTAYSNIVMPIERECEYCKQKSTKMIYATSFFGGTRIRFVCEDHAKQWTNGTLNI